MPAVTSYAKSEISVSKRPSPQAPKADTKGRALVSGAAHRLCTKLGHSYDRGRFYECQQALGSAKKWGHSRPHGSVSDALSQTPSVLGVAARISLAHTDLQSCPHFLALPLDAHLRGGTHRRQPRRPHRLSRLVPPIPAAVEQGPRQATTPARRAGTHSGRTRPALEEGHGPATTLPRRTGTRDRTGNTSIARRHETAGASPWPLARPEPRVVNLGLREPDPSPAY